eukprot:FR740324.1.p1 GENE.FR740324.1~~FR740324.1.p1  ORF type:complete len:273 (+),score=51.08 FR740324.1:74-820(+)
MVSQRRASRESWLLDKKMSKFQVQKEFLELQRRILQPPTLEEVEREREIDSLANIVLIYIEAMLFKDGKVLKEVVKTFDDDGNGFLSHEEFKEVVSSLEGISLSAEQFRDVLRTVDADNDGMVSLAELEKRIEIVSKYCSTPGSPWKLYVDPAQDVTCIHNIWTGEKIFDFRITDKKIKEIVKENFIWEAEFTARSEAHELREKDWERTLQNFSAKIMQNMYRLWAGRRRMDDMRWKIVMHKKEKMKG